MTGKIVALAWTVVLLVGWPIASLRLKKQLAAGPISRADLYVSAVVSQVVMGGVTLAVDFYGPRRGVAATMKLLPWGTMSAWIASTTVACALAWILMILQERRHPHESDRIVWEMLPRTRGEGRAFVGVSLMAGLAEEYVVRGFCLGTLALVTGSLALAYVLTTVAFGLGHLYQGRAGALRAGILGGVLGIPVVVTGALLPSILAHAATDMIAGRWTMQLLAGGGQTSSAGPPCA